MNIRIFFSSPGDVKMERETAKRIVDRLQSEIGERAAIQPYFWEHEVMVATKDYQENIPHMDDFDIVVCILWSRLGTPLDPSRHPKPGGGGFNSGTEYEFFTAMQAHDLRGTPDIFVFRNMTEPRRPSRPKEVREAVDREIDRLDSFFESYFEDEAFFTRAINIYSTLGEFEEKLTIALRSYITGRIPVSGAERVGIMKPVYHRHPYLGLASFDYEDAPVFFGRTAQVGEIITVLQGQELEAQTNTEAPPKHFMLILGSSGSGKSSLARAGVLPMLTNPGVIEGANAWRTAIFKPADQTGDPILALVNSLNTPRALPELFADGTKPSELADLIRTQPQGGGLLLRQALTQAGALALANQKQDLEDKLELLLEEHREEDAKALREKIDSLTPPAVRIALLADQLEELFTSDLSPETLNTFIGILVALANSGRVFLLATLRSDFYPRCLEHPTLIALMQGSGTYALPAPSPADIGQMIRQPAAIAGLEFEENTTTGESLDELLRDAALEDPAALPLLSYTLEQLYEQRTPEGLMTLEAYHHLGGLEGAIGSRAENIFTNLPAEAQASFASLCKQLITLQDGGEPTRRRAFYSTLTRTPESKTLVDALVTARLLTADQSATGDRVIAVAHEALLRHWPRLVAWVAENRLFLSRRTRVASRMADWLEREKSDDYLIPRGPNLSAAEGILAGHLASLDPVEIEFIARSAEKVRREDQRHLRNARLITAGAVVLCLIAVAGGLLAMAAKRTAQKERNSAIAQEKLAKEAKDKAVSSEARSAYINGIEQLEAGKNREGLSSLAQALAIQPKHRGALSRIYSELLYSLPRPVPIRSVMASSQMRQRISGSYSSGNQYVTYIAADKSPEVFDLRKREVVPGPWSEGKKTVAPALTYNSDILLDIQEAADGKYDFRCWDLLSRKAGASVILGSKEFQSMVVTTDGKHFVFAMADGNVNFVSTKTGKTELNWKQSGANAWIYEITGKFIISTYTDEVVIFDLVTKKEKRIKKTDGFDFYEGRVALGAGIFVLQSAKIDDEGIVNRFQFIDPKTTESMTDSRTIEVREYIHEFRADQEGRRIAVAVLKKGPMIFDAYDEANDRVFPDRYAASKVDFSHDGTHLVTATTEGTVNIFNSRTMEPAFSPIPHETRLEDLVMTWNGLYLLTASGTTATVWDLSVGAALAQPMPLPEPPVRTSVSDTHLTVQTDKRIYRFDTRTLERETNSKMLSYVSALVSPSLNRSAAHIGEGLVKFFDSFSEDEAETELAEWTCPEKKVDTWQFSDDGSIFLCITGDRCWLVDSGNGTTKTEYGLPGAAASASYTSYIAADNSRTFHLYPLDKLKYEFGIFGRDLIEEKDLAFQFTDPAKSQLRNPTVTLSPDSRWLAVTTESVGGASLGLVFIWDLRDLSKPAREIPNIPAVQQVLFSPDGTFVAIATGQNGVRIHSLASMELLAPVIYPDGATVMTMAISPDSKTIAATYTLDIKAASYGANTGPSEIRVWDWKEAQPVTRTFNLPTTVSHLNFTKDGKALFSVSPRKGKDEECLVIGWELVPPEELTSSIVPMVEAATAYHIEAGHLPAPINPFLSWELSRKAQTDSWFLQPPEDRSISPAFPVESMRWIKDDLVDIDTLLAAMPCVALSNAAIAHWRQSYLNKLVEELAGMDATTTEYALESKKIDDLTGTIERLKIIPERNPNAHALIPYYLALQARSEKDAYRLKKYALLAYKRNPGDADCAEVAAKVYEDAGHYRSALPILRKLRELLPDDDGYRFRLGTALWELKEKNEAQKEFAAAVENGKLSGFERAIMLIYLGRGAEALPIFVGLADEEKAATEDKNYSLAGLVYLITGQYGSGEKDAAVETYQKLIAAAPGTANTTSIKNAALHPLFTESLIATLKLTLEKYPELAPVEEE